jgi:uncharacterized PurR-regulated membrane protein YhhQ (DUF165 family)
VTAVGFLMAWLTIGVLALATAVPWAPQTRDRLGGRQPPASTGCSPADGSVASTAAYLVAQLLDIGIFHLLKHAPTGASSGCRPPGRQWSPERGHRDHPDARLVGSGIGDIVSTIVTSYLVKVVVAVALTAIYASRAGRRGLKLAPMSPGADYKVV